jgi:hypothetical protein
LPEPLIQLQFGLKLVVKDYPGLDEDHQYQEACKTSNQDLVIVLVDSSVANRCDAFGASGKQRELLDLVEESIDVNEDDSPPLIILGSKVDDPMDKDTKKRVEQVNTCIEEVSFHVVGWCETLGSGQVPGGGYQRVQFEY